MQKLRYVFTLLAVFLMLTPASAVLKEKDLPQTLSILRHELERTHNEMGRQQQVIMEQSDALRKKLIETMAHANQNALMLYSQRNGYVFDLAYACHEATNQYETFRRDVLPYQQFVQQNDIEVTRYDSLIVSLTSMPVMMLDDKARIDRNVCLTLAVNIRRMVKENRQQLQDYMKFYQMTEKQLKHLNDYAQQRYKNIQSNIFVNGDNNYFQILSRLGYHFNESRETVEQKYGVDTAVHSQWDSRIIVFLFFIIIFYGLISIVLNQLIIRLALTKILARGRFGTDIHTRFMAKRACIILTTTAVTFAAILNIIRAVVDQHFILMASNLLTSYAWLMSAILISIIIRVEANRTMRTFFIYAPLLVMGFIVISFRIVLIPNALVKLILPPLLLATMLWQWHVMKRYKDTVQKSDRYFAYITQAIFIVSVIASWIGYTLLSVQILIWWIMQLTCILSIACVKDWYDDYAIKHNLAERPITQTWFYDLFTKAITPSAAILSFIISIYWAADIFNLTEMAATVFSYKFVDSENFVASLKVITQVLILFCVFNYLNSTVKQLVRFHYDKQDRETAESRSVMVVNVLQVIIWGAWLLIALAICHISNQWLIVISGGLSTGIGFASKDILENIYYGISLMAGRIKIGDFIVCDGTRGKVVSISYTSTMIEAIDGSIIAFQNSQLFTKNYKNLTRNHDLEVAILDVGVAYGSNIAKVREMLVAAVSALPCVITENHKVDVRVSEFADSSVNLKVICWVSVYTSATDSSTIMECIYNTLNDNNIEIPFPQHDVYIKKESTTKSN